MSVSIDLIALYGKDTLHKGQEFQSGAAVTAFVKDYALKGNKHVIVTTSSGRCKKYGCDTEGCTWHVTATKSKKKPFNFYISSLCDQHGDACISSARPSRRQIANITEFRVAVTSDSSVSRKALTATVQSTSRISLHKQRSTLYRAKEDVVSAHQGDYEKSFGQIPVLLRELEKINPGSTIALENDQDRRFFRAFVCLAGTVRALPLCQSIFGFDGAHFKMSKYTGRALTLVAFAVVSSENEDNVRWFINPCLHAGVPLAAESVPLFCDRGVLLNVAVALQRENGVTLNLKYCSLHIIRNIKKNFGVNGNRLEHHIWAIQGAATAEHYDTSLAKLESEFGAPLAKYVRDIPSQNWTVHASSEKLYGWRSTNFVESNNAVIDKSGI